MWPPAEKPHTAMRVGSMGRVPSAAILRSKRTARQPSAKHCGYAAPPSGSGSSTEPSGARSPRIGCAPMTAAYSTSTPTMPWRAAYCAVPMPLPMHEYQPPPWNTTSAACGDAAASRRTVLGGGRNTRMQGCALFGQSASWIGSSGGSAGCQCRRKTRSAAVAPTASAAATDRASCPTNALMCTGSGMFLTQVRTRVPDTQRGYLLPWWPMADVVAKGGIGSLRAPC
eukprot:7055397-Prymnesium_polylepis.1